jgi:dCTP diphosphatase
MGELKELQKAVVKFRDERDWLQFHTPKNLAQALASEVGELNDLFLWNREDKNGMAEVEMADILIYLLSLADVLRVDLIAAVYRKLVVNKFKYPAKDCKGSDAKYQGEPK